MIVIALSILTILVLILFVPKNVFVYTLFAIPVFVVLIVLFYPLAKLEIEAGKIDRDLHLFMIRIRILSLAEVSGKGLFYILEEMKEYGRLATEVTKIYNLSKGFKINLSDACRFVARTTPSRLLGDFLNRLAHAIDTGEDLRVFLRNEQEVVLEEYKTKYEAQLNTATILNEVFIAAAISATFIVVLALIMPLAVPGISAIRLAVISIFILILLEIAFLVIFSVVLPKEQLWQTTGIKTSVDIRIMYSLILAVLVSIGIGLTVVTLKLPLHISLGLIVTPLCVPGLIALVEQRKIKRRDDMYPTYIRSLGLTSEAKLTVPTEILKKLRHHDFGELTKNIDALFKRLSTKIDDLKSWRYFSAESGSNLISKFNEMYVRGTSVGGSPKDVSIITSSNFIKILQLRKKRYQNHSTLIGLLYGVTFAVAFSIFTTVYIVEWMDKLVTDLDIPEILGPGALNIPLLAGLPYDISLLTTLALLLIIVNAIICAIIINIFGIEHKTIILLHFVGLIWLSIAVYIIVIFLMDLLLI
jgi:flagellar protein FlaJ